MNIAFHAKPESMDILFCIGSKMKEDPWYDA